MTDRHRYTYSEPDPLVMIVLYVVWFFLGSLGVHRMVTGRLASGVAMLLLHGMGWLTIWLLGLGLLFWIPLGVWWLVDAFLIPGWSRRPVGLVTRLR